jgi:polar amino acid transport system permease protein
MSAPTAEREATTLDVGVGRIGLAAYVLFWGWLVARWTNDWILPEGVGPGRGEPFVSPSLVERLGESVVEVAVMLPLSLGAPVVVFLDSAVLAVSYLPALAAGVYVTLLLTVAGIAFGFVIAVPLSVSRVYGGPLKYPALAYTELIRGTPLLAQLFVLYYGTNLTVVIRELPGVGVGPIPAQAFWVAIIGFTINSSAYQSEYIRSALQSVDEGQLTAARAVGLSKIEGIRYVVLPQGLRLAIPGWSNELVYLIKYSSLASFITVRELFKAGQSIASQNFRFLLVFTLVALMYLAVVITVSKLTTEVERRTAIPGLGSGDD